jgi:cullin 3
VEMETGVKNMLVNNKYEELSNLYNLFKFYEPSLHELSRIFKTYIEGKGKTLKEDKEKFKDPKKFIPELIALKNEINSLVEKCFEINSILQNANYDGFKNFMKS